MDYTELSPERSETVLLFHGLGRTSLSMRRLTRTLERTGYRTVNVNYPSRCAPIARLADDVVGRAVDEALANDPERLHFVTHSLGGILVRHWAARHTPLPGSRAVLIAPPNNGSEAADLFGRLAPLRWWCGPALGELGTDEASVPATLGPVALETGVIAGARNYYPGLDRLYEDASDGLVAVDRTRVEGMADFLVVPRGQTFIMRAPDTILQTLHFLRNGRFEHFSLTRKS